LIWLVPLLPLVGLLIVGLLRNTLPKRVAGIIASGVVFLSFLVSCSIFYEVYQARQAGGDASLEIKVFAWIQVGSLDVALSFLVDTFSAVMLLIVTRIGLLLHVYSTGYMKHEAGFNKFFSYLNLFIFFMLLLVLGSNHLVMFIGREGVGLCSYLLIGFWYK